MQNISTLRFWLFDFFLSFSFFLNKIIYLTKLGAQLVEPKMCVMDGEDSLGNSPATVTELESPQTL